MIINRIYSALAAALALAGLIVDASPVRAEVYEMRTYTTQAGKLDALNARFRDHTVRLFQKHGIESIGYWVPTDEEKSKNTLIYIIKHDSRDAAAKSWQAFLADSEWKKAARESGVGRLASRPESVYMESTDYSPEWSNDKEGADDHLFELRIYKAKEGKLGKLDARFRDHTIKLFERHGIKSVGYWHPTDEPDSEDTLIYIIQHDSREPPRNHGGPSGPIPTGRRQPANRASEASPSRQPRST